MLPQSQSVCDSQPVTLGPEAKNTALWPEKGGEETPESHRCPRPLKPLTDSTQTSTGPTNTHRSHTPHKHSDICRPNKSHTPHRFLSPPSHPHMLLAHGSLPAPHSISSPPPHSNPRLPPHSLRGYLPGLPGGHRPNLPNSCPSSGGPGPAAAP